MVSQWQGTETLLTGLLDRSALYAVLAEIEALGLDLVDVRHLTVRKRFWAGRPKGDLPAIPRAQLRTAANSRKHGI